MLEIESLNSYVVAKGNCRKGNFAAKEIWLQRNFVTKGNKI